MNAKGVITKTYGPLSSGTRCEILGNPGHNEFGDFVLDVLVGPFSEAFYRQNHELVKTIIANDGVIDIPAEYVQALQR